MTMDKVEMKEKIEKGAVVSKVILEVLGSPKDHVEASLKKYLETLEKDPTYDVLKQEVHNAEEQESKMFSAFAEVEMLAKDMNSLIGFCFDYMPSSVDVIEPKNFTFGSEYMGGFLNDLIARLHGVDKLARNASAQAKLDRRNMVLVIRYSILHNLKQGAKTKDELKVCTGLADENLSQYVEALEKGGLIKKEGDKFSITDKVTFKNGQ